MFYFVYDLVDPRDALPFYVGATTNPNSRMTQHLSKDGSNPRKDKRISDIQTCAMLPQMRLLETLESKREALRREAHWIKEYEQRFYPITNIVGATSELLAKKARTQPVIPEPVDAEDQRLINNILFQYSYSVTRMKIQAHLLKMKRFDLPERDSYTIHELLDRLPYSDREIGELCQLNEATIKAIRERDTISYHRAEQLILYLSWIYQRCLEPSKVKGLHLSVTHMQRGANG